MNQRTIDRVIAVLTEKYHYKVHCEQVGEHRLELTIIDKEDETVAIVELLLPIDCYEVKLRRGYHQLNARGKRKIDELIRDFSDNPILPHLTNYSKMPMSNVFKYWEHYLDSCHLIDSKKNIYLGNNGYYQVDDYGYINPLKTVKVNNQTSFI